ncbi:MAG: HIT domain-containing protein [Phycisphaerales bacterium]|nr:MAG: HIT domain-containing protein [Phycisphaerales bacterium]
MTRPQPVLHAPWRERYLRALAAGGEGASPGKDSTGCFLRDYWLAPRQDEANHVIVRRADDAADAPDAPTGGMVLLNLYPYANGHLLVALGDGRARLLDYAPAQRAALWRLVEDAAAILSRALSPQGVNIGVNEGAAAGAGVPGHLHVHLVPRWHGDVNFMTVVGGVRVHPSAPERVAAMCREAWGEIASSARG